MTIDYNKAPFPYFGGKRKAAPLIWSRFGDPGHYVEPFMGSLAVLLERPHICNRAYFSESVNDADGYLCNAWRSIQLHPEETADAASYPVSEADLMARHLWLLKWKKERELEHLMGDLDWCDPRAAGYWLWGQCCWIGSGWCSGTGPWVVGPTGRIEKQARAGSVWRQLPLLISNGQGVNHASLREEGVNRQLPNLNNNGQGVNRPQLREEGVDRKRPHLNNNGRGVNHALLREEGVGDFHPMTMPELTRWFEYLSARIRHVRILNGDWSRLTTRSATKTLSCNLEHPCAVFLDPPYSGDERAMGLYTEESGTVAADVLQWCLKNGDDPLLRIALAGYSGEGHEKLEASGWTVEEWFAAGFLTGGMGNTNANGHQQTRERIWFSSHCLGHEVLRQGELF